MFSIQDSQHPVIVFGALLLGIFFMMKKESRRKLLLNFKDIHFMIYFVAIALFSYFVLSSPAKSDKSRRLKEAVRKAIVAFMIAYLARLDMVFAPFLIVFSVDYFLSGWE